MNQPTAKQIQWLWEQCGFKQVSRFGGSLSQATEYLWLYPEDKHYKDLPPIDLNNLFKYAVPKLLGGDRYLFITFDVTSNDAGWVACEISTLKGEKLTRVKWEAFDKDPALALFWAIYKALGGEE